MIRCNMKRKDMTEEELTEHKRVLKQQYNSTYYKKKKSNKYQAENGNDNINNNTNNNDNDNDNINDNDFGMLHALYELYNITDDDRDIEQMIHIYEQKLSIPLKERFIYAIYNGDNYSSDEDN